MVLGAAKWRENIRKSKDPGFAPRPGQTLKKKVTVDPLFPKNIISRKVPCKHWLKTVIEFLHAFWIPTHFPKKLARFLFQQIATPPNYYFYHLEVLQSVSTENSLAYFFEK